MIKDMAREYLNGEMGERTEGNGKMENRTEQVTLKHLTSPWSKKVNGIME